MIRLPMARRARPEARDEARERARRDITEKGERFGVRVPDDPTDEELRQAFIAILRVRGVRLL